MNEFQTQHETTPQSGDVQAQLVGNRVAPAQVDPTSYCASPIVLSPPNSEATDSPEKTQADACMKAPNTPCLPERSKATRNRLSAAERKAKLEAVVDDYRAGHPALAIMLRNRLSKPQFIKMLAGLLLDGTLTPVPPSYEVIPASKSIKSIPGLGVSADGYIRVVQTEGGVLLTPYNAQPGGEESDVETLRN